MSGDDSGRRSIRYQPDDRPPLALSLGLGLQLAILVLAGIVLIPTVVVRAAGGSETYLSWVVFAAVAVCGLTTALQALRLGRIGAGYILVGGSSGAFIAVCVVAIAEGGRRCSPPWSSSPRSASSHSPPGSRCSGGS